MPSSNRPSTARPVSQGRSTGSFVRPLSARSNMSRNAETTTSNTAMSIQGFAVRPTSALTIAETNSEGLWFYKCPKSGSLPYSNPKYTIPK